VGFKGMSVGLAVMAVLIASLVYALVIVVRAASGRTVPEGPKWATYLIPLLSVIGLCVAGYLTYVETHQVAAICGPIGDCNTVQSSPFAKLFGFLPVGLFGVLGYLAILIAWGVGRLARNALPVVAGLVVFVLALFGVLFSMYLTYLELVVIRAVCMWCLTSAVLMAALLALSTDPLGVWLAPPQEAEA
jgi:uncharacterized membrane protein